MSRGNDFDLCCLQHGLNVRASASYLRLLLISSFLLAATETALADPTPGEWVTTESDNWPLVPVHAALTPDGRVLTFGSDSGGTATGFFIYDVWDPAEGLSGGHVTLPNMTETEIFCGSSRHAA